MGTYDWIVIGGGITGSALSYELVKQGFSVLLVEKETSLDNATRYSYGGLAYWSGTTPLSQQLCQEGLARHRQLSQELESETEFQERQLLLTIDANDDPQPIATDFQSFAIAPTLLTVSEAIAQEPLLNPQAISGALRLPHGHIHPGKTAHAYQKTFQRLGGVLEIAEVTQLLSQPGKILGVNTRDRSIHAAHTVICAGGLSRRLLTSLGIRVPVYFTHAQLIQTPPVAALNLRSLVMPAVQSRLALEASAIDPALTPLWDQGTDQLIASAFEVGAVQFQDGHFCLGQISDVSPSPVARIDATSSEMKIRQGIDHLLPQLATLPGTWYRCLVAFAPNAQPQIGAIAGWEGLHLFSGFTSPLVLVPPLAQHFAAWVAGEPDDIMAELGVITSNSP